MDLIALWSEWAHKTFPALLDGFAKTVSMSYFDRVQCSFSLCLVIGPWISQACIKDWPRFQPLYSDLYIIWYKHVKNFNRNSEQEKKPEKF